MQASSSKASLSDFAELFAEQLTSGGSVTFEVNGTSMLPLIKKGDSVVIVKPRSMLKKYDIPFYQRSDGSYVLHRIVGFKDGKYICRGDHQSADEYGVEPESVIGVATHIVRGGKRIPLDSFRQKLYAVLRVFFTGLKQ